MTQFEYRAGRLHAESVDLVGLAEALGTPTYVYSRAGLEAAWRGFDDALGEWPHLICYAVKANSNLGVLGVLADLGSGFDIVSEGELERVLAVGGDPSRIVFSGVGKSPREMARALEVGIRCFNVESPEELFVLDDVAGHLGKVAPVSLRVNPDVDAQTHPYIATGLAESKFGIPIEEAAPLYRAAAARANLSVVGVDCHIGSQLTSLSPIQNALAKVLELVDALGEEGICLEHVDVGGGLGIQYRDEVPPSFEAYARAVCSIVGERSLEIVIEPGRAICGNAGVLLTKVEYTKRNGTHGFAIVDAAMNDFLRPALYQAWCDIVPLLEGDQVAEGLVDVVGPVCESADFLGRGRTLEASPGAFLAVRSAGAYGFVMSSNYNSRPRAAEVVVDGAVYHVTRTRESIADLMRGESTLAQTTGHRSSNPGTQVNVRETG